jgi:hypothetical protein
MLDQTPFDEPLDLPGGESRPAAPHSFQPPKRRRSKKPFATLLFIIILCALGYGAFKWLGRQKPASQPQTNNTPAVTPPKTTQPQTAAGTKTFTAETQAISFDHPDTWTVVEKDGAITATSPDFDYQTNEGEQVNGHFKLYLRVSARAVDSKYIGRGIAMQPTETLTYTKPAPSQLKTTRLIFFGYDSTDNFAFFMITNNFNLKKGDTLGPSYGKEATTYIIAGGYATSATKDDLSFQMVSPDSFATTDAYKQALDILKSLQVS